MPTKARRQREPIASVPFKRATFEVLKAIAAQDGRSMSSLIQMAVEQWLTSRDGKKMQQHLTETAHRRSELEEFRLRIGVAFPPEVRDAFRQQNPKFADMGNKQIDDLIRDTKFIVSKEPKPEGHTLMMAMIEPDSKRQDTDKATQSDPKDKS